MVHFVVRLCFKMRCILNYPMKHLISSWERAFKFLIPCIISLRKKHFHPKVFSLSAWFTNDVTPDECMERKQSWRSTFSKKCVYKTRIWEICARTCTGQSAIWLKPPLKKTSINVSRCVFLLKIALSWNSGITIFLHFTDNGITTKTV